MNRRLSRKPYARPDLDGLLDGLDEADGSRRFGLFHAGAAVAVDVISLPIAILVASASFFKLAGRPSAKRAGW